MERAVAEPNRREHRFSINSSAEVFAKCLGLIAVLPACLRVELRQSVGKTLESLERQGIVDVVPVPVATGDCIIAEHARGHQAGHHEILPIGNVLHIGRPLTDDPIGGRLQSCPIPLEPLPIAGEEIAIGHGKQESARGGVRAVVAVAHVVSHGGGPLQGATAIRIIAVRLRPGAFRKCS